MPDVICTIDKDCPEGVPVVNGNGIFVNKPFFMLAGTLISFSGVRTGKCVQSTLNETLKTCEIHAWCPVENDTLPLYERHMA
jgi:P2X purinoceptor 4